MNNSSSSSSSSLAVFLEHPASDPPIAISDDGALTALGRGRGRGGILVECFNQGGEGCALLCLKDRYGRVAFAHIPLYIPAFQSLVSTQYTITTWTKILPVVYHDKTSDRQKGVATAQTGGQRQVNKKKTITTITCKIVVQGRKLSLKKGIVRWPNAALQNLFTAQKGTSKRRQRAKMTVQMPNQEKWSVQHCSWMVAHSKNQPLKQYSCAKSSA